MATKDQRFAVAFTPSKVRAMVVSRVPLARTRLNWLSVRTVTPGVSAARSINRRPFSGRFSMRSVDTTSPSVAFSVCSERSLGHHVGALCHLPNLHAEVQTGLLSGLQHDVGAPFRHETGGANLHGVFAGQQVPHFIRTLRIRTHFAVQPCRGCAIVTAAPGMTAPLGSRDDAENGGIQSLRGDRIELCDEDDDSPENPLADSHTSPLDLQRLRHRANVPKIRNAT